MVAYDPVNLSHLWADQLCYVICWTSCLLLECRYSSWKCYCSSAHHHTQWPSKLPCACNQLFDIYSSLTLKKMSKRIMDESVITAPCSMCMESRVGVGVLQSLGCDSRVGVWLRACSTPWLYIEPSTTWFRPCTVLALLWQVCMSLVHYCAPFIRTI